MCRVRRGLPFLDEPDCAELETALPIPRKYQIERHINEGLASREN